jgi:energy-coupling factor transporter ATP-binding protein EcfA2
MTTPWNQGKTIMPEPSLRRTVHLGQFRMTRLQVVNWGTFCGYKDFPIDERGVLFTGPSGSGKSTLMDAHSAALLPSYDQQFNASADMTARGARQGTRTITDYVRGAWSETDDEHEQSKVQYLRGGKPTWSAIGVTYDDGLGTVITGVVIRWFTGTETDSGSLKSLHHVYEGAFDLSALNEWASRGFDTRWLRAAHPPVNAEGPTAYMRELAKRIGLGTSRTALSLLGKAKAMKNVGDLNLFIRDNMLDEPATFAAAQKMLAAFTPLNEAYETAYRAHRQDQVLRDVPGSWTIYEEAGQARLLTETVMGTPAEHYLREIHLRVLGEEIDRIDAEVTTLNATRGEREEEEGRLFGEYESLLGATERRGTAAPGPPAPAGIGKGRGPDPGHRLPGIRRRGHPRRTRGAGRRGRLRCLASSPARDLARRERRQGRDQPAQGVRLRRCRAGQASTRGESRRAHCPAVRQDPHPAQGSHAQGADRAGRGSPGWRAALRSGADRHRPR